MSTETAVRELDAVVIGAGFSGLFMNHRLRDTLGLDVHVIEPTHNNGGWQHSRGLDVKGIYKSNHVGVLLGNFADNIFVGTEAVRVESEQTSFAGSGEQIRQGLDHVRR